MVIFPKILIKIRSRFPKIFSDWNEYKDTIIFFFNSLDMSTKQFRNMPKGSFNNKTVVLIEGDLN